MVKIGYINNESGMALVIALVMLLALTVIGISSIMTSTLDIQLSSNERRAAEALNLADAGIEKALHDLLYDYKRDTDWANVNLIRLSLETGAQVTNSLGAAEGNFDNAIGPQFGTPFSDDGNISGGIGNAVAPYGVETLGNGKYRVLLLRDPGEKDDIYIRSYAEHTTGARKIIQLHLGLDTVDAWRNALFAGRGSATAAITGNINIAGSIHILGTGATNDMTISGNSGVMNGYQHLSAGLKDRLLLDATAACPHCGLELLGTWSGRDVYSLETVFRVKNVQTDITGSGMIGEPGNTDTEGDDPGGGVYDVTDGDGNGFDNIYTDSDYAGVAYKSSIDAVYTNLPFEPGDVDALLSDQPQKDYDLGDKIQMPTLEDPYDPSIHVNRDGDTCGTCTNYKQYIETMSVEFDASTLVDTGGGAGSSSCRLTTSAGAGGSTTPTADFSYGSMTCTDAADLSTCSCTDPNGCIKWVNNPGTDASGQLKPHLWVDGRVEIKGCPSGFTIADNSNTNPVVYRGKGIIYTANDVTIGESFLNYGANKFLEDDLMAVMTPGDMRMNITAQDTSMGAFYAGGTIGTNQQGNVIGAMMGNVFCLATDVNLATGACASASPAGGNAADIYYTPGISEELTKLGMLKGRQVFTFSVYSWQQIY